MARYRLSKTVPRISIENDARVWTIKITCTVPEGSADDPHVFVYQTSASEAGDTFFDVADSRDLSVIPVEGEEADSNLTATAGAQFNNIPFYRVAEAVFNCYNACEIDRIWEMVKMKVQNLSWELDALESDTWKETEYETI